MHHPLTHYHGPESTDLAELEADAADLAADLEMVAMEVAEGISAGVEESRQHAEHRKMLYMVGAPLIVYAGLTNTKHKGLGLLSALVGAYVGVKNYQDAKAEEEATAALGGYGAPGSRKCVRKKPGRRCPHHLPRLRKTPNGFVCCRRR